MSEATLEADEEAIKTRTRRERPADEKATPPPQAGSPTPVAPVSETVSRQSEAKASAPRSESKMRRRPRRRPPHLWYAVLAVVVVSAIAVTAYLIERRPKVAGQTQPSPGRDNSAGATLSPAQRAAVTVEVAQKRMLWADVTAPGKVAFNSNKVTPVFSQFSGRIVKLEAEVGTSVRTGQGIGTIDTPDIVTMQSDCLQGLAAVRSAHTTLELARRISERTKRLAAAEAVPQRDLQQALSDESRAADDLQRAESAVAAARGRLQSAGMKEAEIARLESGSRAVNRLVPLVAPISGTITERKAGVGQVVQSANGDPLFMIADLSTVWVNADVYEDQLANIHMGGPVKITAQAYPGEVFAARVDQIGSTLDPDKHTVAVRCVVPNHKQRLKPGMFATVILGSDVPQDVITVPASAVVVEGEERAIFIEEGPGNYVKRAVETGSEVGGSVIIRAGLKEGERVVVHGGLLLSASKTE